MSNLTIELPTSLQQTLEELAKRDNVSVNQFITLAVAEKISALMTEEYLADRAKRGSRAKFDAALAQVADVVPEAGDEL